MWRWAGPGLLAKVPRGGSAGTALPGSQNRPLLKLEHVVLAWVIGGDPCDPSCVASAQLVHVIAGVESGVGGISFPLGAAMTGSIETTSMMPVTTRRTTFFSWG